MDRAGPGSAAQRRAAISGAGQDQDHSRTGQGTYLFANRIKGGRQGTGHAQVRSVPGTYGYPLPKSAATSLMFALVFCFIENIVSPLGRSDLKCTGATSQRVGVASQNGTQSVC